MVEESYQLANELDVFKVVFENSLCGMLLADLTTNKICLANEKACEILGYTKEEIKKLQITNIHPSNYLSKVKKSGKWERNYFSGGKIPVKRKDGHIIYVDIHSISVKINGKTFLLGVFTGLENIDVTESIITAIDKKGNILFINEGGCKILGYEKEDIIGKNWFDDFLPENIRDKIRETFKNLIRRKDSKHIEYPVLTKNGERILRWRHTTLKNSRGKLTGIFSLGEDVTEKRKVEKALWVSEEKYRLMVENLEDYAIYMIDKNGKIMSWNKGAERIKGYKEKEVIGMHFSHFYTKEDIENDMPEKMLRIAKEKGKYKGEGWRVRKNGKLFWAQVVITALKDENGNLQGFVNVTKDLTERKVMEEKIMNAYEQVKKALEKEREFKRDTAHYFFNPIAIAKGYLSLALEEVDKKESKENIEKAIVAISRVEKVVKNITERGEIVE